LKVAVRIGFLALALCGASGLLRAQQPPVVRMQNGASQLVVNGKPFLMLAGELGNSSAGTAAEADAILPKLARLHFNTVLMPVAWDEIEPEEGRFDYSILDHWIEVARQQHMHLVFLWFGSWKNAFSEYAPEWVLRDTQRFPREISADGVALDILSPLGQETARCDARAFTALMRHLREEDAAQQTVLMVQVENEIGFVGVGGRDRSDAANRLFADPVPAELGAALRAHPAQISRELASRFNPHAATWKEMFGDTADEVFMAWEYAKFVDQVAAAGKAAYALPMYMNAQLPAPREQAGDYPSGGPYPLLQAIYRAGVPTIDFYAPDIYWPDFEEWVERYQAAGNPAFVPEARLDVAAANAFYLYGEARGFGFSPFAVDSLDVGSAKPGDGPSIADVYGVLGPMSDAILDAQQRGAIRGLVLHANSLRPSQTFSLGGFLMRTTLARSWPTMQLGETDGAMLALQSAPNEFLIAGSGLSVTFRRDPDADGQIAGIASVEQMKDVNGQWVTERQLNGDQTDQGRQLLMDPHQVRVYRVRLYVGSAQH